MLLSTRKFCSSYFQLLWMGKLKPGCMTTLAPELTMMLLGYGALQCFTVLMEVGKIGEIHNSRPNKILFYFSFCSI